MSELEMLTRIFDRLGGIDAQLVAGSKRHDEFAARHKELAQSISEVDTRLESVETIVPTVRKMEPIVEDYQANKNKVIGIFLTVSGLASIFGFFASKLPAFLRGGS